MQANCRLCAWNFGHLANYEEVKLEWYWVWCSTQVHMSSSYQISSFYHDFIMM